MMAKVRRRRVSARNDMEMVRKTRQHEGQMAAQMACVNQDEARIIAFRGALQPGDPILKQK
jgi:hypothetical protein